VYTFELSDRPLSHEEQAVFQSFLDHYHMDEGIWPVFDGLFRSATRYTTPLMLRAYDGSALCGAAVIVRCSRYGRALFRSRLMAGLVDAGRLPLHLWIRFGCCMDMMSNPGFARDPEKADDMAAAMAAFLKESCLLTLVCDYTDRAHLYPDAAILPALPHALIDTSGMTSVADYTAAFGNLARKMNKFRNKGGSFEIVREMLPASDLPAMQRCFVSTSETSVFYLPYQDLYLESAVTTSTTRLDGACYFVARMDGELMGYQAALQTGTRLNALHGAFDRERGSSYHAYDVLFVKMVEFAIENGIDRVDLGAVLNRTKQKMVNTKLDLSYFLLGRRALVQKAMTRLMGLTRVQSDEQLQFRETVTAPLPSRPSLPA
jgi:hypothetical protein